MLSMRNLRPAALLQSARGAGNRSVKLEYKQWQCRNYVPPVAWRTSLYVPTYSPFARVHHFSTTSASAAASVPIQVSSTLPSTEIHVRKKSWSAKIVEKVKEEAHRLVIGSKQLGKNTKTAAYLLRGVLQGKSLSRRERILLVTTISDLARMVPFIIILVIPFAEFCLPVLLKLFPNMLPSTFTSTSQKESAQARSLKAKLEVIKVLQAASEDIVLRGKLTSKSVHESLVAFMTKVSKGDEITVEEILEISKQFNNEFSVYSLEKPQLRSLTKFFGLPTIGTSYILQEELKFKWNLVKQDDAHILREGIDHLTPLELEEAAYSRGYCPSNSHQDKAKYLKEWIALSQENVPPYLLLLSRAHYFVTKTKECADIRPPVITPYVPPLTQPLSHPTDAPLSPPDAASPLAGGELVPEKELIDVETKTNHHELSHDPVVEKLWVQIARFTSDLKRETFGGDAQDVIYLGDSSGDKLSTVITRELRQYLQAIFIALDKNGDKKLSVDEVESGLNASDVPLPHEDVVNLVKMHDSNGDECLSFDEFVDCLLYIRKYRM